MLWSLFGIGKFITESNLAEYADMELSFKIIEWRSIVYALELFCQIIYFLKKELLISYVILLDLLLEKMTAKKIMTITNSTILSKGALLDTNKRQII